MSCARWYPGVFCTKYEARSQTFDSGPSAGCSSWTFVSVQKTIRPMDQSFTLCVVRSLFESGLGHKSIPSARRPIFATKQVPLTLFDGCLLIQWNLFLFGGYFLSSCACQQCSGIWTSAQMSSFWLVWATPQSRFGGSCTMFTARKPCPNPQSDAGC